MTGEWPGLIVVGGATATGKSELALDIAERLGAEIINADALQFYRGMDIGTAKLPVPERRGIPHHMIDVLDLTEEASVAAFQRQAHAIIDELAARHVPAVLVGGSGLYVRAVVDGLEFPGTDSGLRAALESRAETEGLAPLARELAARDPKAAQAIRPTDARRVIRALEVMDLTGRPFSATLPSYDAVYPTIQLGLTLPREELNTRIQTRVDRMWQAGWVDEVRGLLGRGLDRAHTAGRALGYRQIAEFLNGEMDAHQAREDTVLRTRQFAKRQGTWFRRDPRIEWIPAGPEASSVAAAHLDRLL